MRNNPIKEDKVSSYPETLSFLYSVSDLILTVFCRTVKKFEQRALTSFNLFCFVLLRDPICIVRHDFLRQPFEFAVCTS